MLKKKESDKAELCLGCHEELCTLDEDPNGEMNCVCARCRAEEEHDFDKEPNAVFGRAGRRIDEETPDS